MPLTQAQLALLHDLFLLYEHNDPLVGLRVGLEVGDEVGDEEGDEVGFFVGALEDGALEDEDGALEDDNGLFEGVSVTWEQFPTQIFTFARVPILFTVTVTVSPLKSAGDSQLLLALSFASSNDGEK